MRIGFAADTYKPYVSGVTNYMALYKREFERQGHEVSIFTFGPRGFDPGEERIYYNPGFTLKVGYSLGLAYSRETVQCMRGMDVVHVHHPFISGQLALRLCKPGRIPVVFTSHTRYDLLAQHYMPFLPEGVRLVFLRWYMPRFCAAVQRVICNSAAAEQTLRNCGVKVGVKRIPNAVDITAFTQADRSACRAKLLGDTQEVVALCISRLAPEKNLVCLIQAFARLAESAKNVRLVLVGDGPLRSDLERLAGQLGIHAQVTLVGSVPYAQIPEYIAAADLFVFPSTSETHPLVIVEAMAGGLPVVVADSPAYLDTVEDGVNGFVAPDDPQALAERMARIVGDPELRLVMGQRSRERAGLHAIPGSAQVLLDEYRELVEGKNRDE
jgi:glycosyltransferase involved in cell wall biosynthesis